MRRCCLLKLDQKFGDVSIKFEKDFKIFDGINELEYFDKIILINSNKFLLGLKFCI